MSSELGAPWLFLPGHAIDAAPDAFSIGKSSLRATPAAREHIEQARAHRAHRDAVRAAERATYLADKGW